MLYAYSRNTKDCLRVLSIEEDVDLRKHLKNRHAEIHQYRHHHQAPGRLPWAIMLLNNPLSSGRT